MVKNFFWLRSVTVSPRKSIDLDHRAQARELPSTEPPLSEFLNTLDNRLIQNGNPQNLNLTDVEKDQLEAFLLTLTGVSIYADPKLSDPF